MCASPADFNDMHPIAIGWVGHTCALDAHEWLHLARHGIVWPWYTHECIVQLLRALVQRAAEHGAPLLCAPACVCTEIRPRACWATKLPGGQPSTSLSPPPGGCQGGHHLSGSWVALFLVQCLTSYAPSTAHLELRSHRRTGAGGSADTAAGVGWASAAPCPKCCMWAASAWRMFGEHIPSCDVIRANCAQKVLTCIIQGVVEWCSPMQPTGWPVLEV
jgi:hypothetical protein